MTNIAQMANVLQSLLVTDGPKMLLTPTYHVYRLYLPFQDATLLPVKFAAGVYRQGEIELPGLDAVAARDATGKIWLAVTNLDPEQEARLAIGVDGVAGQTAEGQVLTAAKFDAVNSFEAPDRVAPKPIAATARDGRLELVLPAKSVAVLGVR
jgi:alpha-N-arabinofuranosidase